MSRAGRCRCPGGRCETVFTCRAVKLVPVLWLACSRVVGVMFVLETCGVVCKASVSFELFELDLIQSQEMGKLILVSR